MLTTLVGACHESGSRRPNAHANRHGLTDDADSAFVLCTKAEFDLMSPHVAQDLFRRRHILVTNSPQPLTKFDRKGLSKLTDWKKPITVQGLSKSIYEFLKFP